MRIVYHPKVDSDSSAIMGYYEEVATAALADEFYCEFTLAVKTQPNVQSPSGCGHATYGALISRDFRSTFFCGLSMIPFAF